MSCINFHLPNDLNHIKFTYRYDLMRNCWQKNPKERQTFTNLIQTLDIIMEDSTQYLLLDNIHKVTQGDETISEKLVKENDTVNVERYVRP